MRRSHRGPVIQDPDLLRRLARDSDLPITEIAYQTGRASLGTFGRTFRDITGTSPSKLRTQEKVRPHALEFCRNAS